MSYVPGKPWFSHKRYGYGAGLPMAWQGWTVVALFIAVETGGRLLGGGGGAWVCFLGVVGLIVVIAVKTEGGWRWRWGKD